MIPFVALPTSISASDRKGLVQNILDDIESDIFAKQGQLSLLVCGHSLLRHVWAWPFHHKRDDHFESSHKAPVAYHGPSPDMCRFVGSFESNYGHGLTLVLDVANAVLAIKTLARMPEGSTVLVKPSVCNHLLDYSRTYPYPTRTSKSCTNLQHLQVHQVLHPKL